MFELEVYMCLSVLVQLGTSDPFVRFEVHHWHVESDVKPGTLNPVWLNDKGEEGQVGEPTTLATMQ